MNSDNIYPVITLYQPWATWIIRGWKTIETRTHNRFVSLKDKDILIHAGLKTDASDLTIKNPYLSKYEISHNPDEMVNGAILGIVNVYRTARLDRYDSKAALIDCEFTERFGLFLNLKQVFKEPIYVKGEMGIWYYDLNNKQKVKNNS